MSTSGRSGRNVFLGRDADSSLPPLALSGFVIDCPFPASSFSSPSDLLAKIKLMTGVVEVGLFCDVAKAAYFGNADGTITSRTAAGEVKEGISFDVQRNPVVA